MPQSSPLDVEGLKNGPSVAIRTAISYLHQQSVAAKNPEITALIAEALHLCDCLAADGEKCDPASPHAIHYLYFLKAILGLPPQKLKHLIAILEWLTIIPAQLPA